MKKVLVVGASGVLGKLICEELFRIFQHQVDLTITDYKEERGKQVAATFQNPVKFKYLDVSKEESIENAIKGSELVVVAVKQEAPLLQKICFRQQVDCIDVSPFGPFIEKIKEVYHASKTNAGSMVMSGFFPGLSGLLAKRAISDFQIVHELHIGLLQHTNAKAGVSGILDMLTIISKQVSSETVNDFTSGFSKKRRMYFSSAHKEWEVRLIEHDEKKVLQHKLKTENIYYWTSWNQSYFNKLLSVIRQTGLIALFQKGNNKRVLSKLVKHNPNKNEDAYLSVQVKGLIDDKRCTKTVSLATLSDYHTTAMATAALAKIMDTKRVKGVAYPFEVTTLDELLATMNNRTIVIHEFIE